MRRFGTILLAAVIGSTITLLAYQWIAPTGQSRLEQAPATPISRVAYKSGDAIYATNFTETAEKVLPAVVHIRSIVPSTRGSQQVPDAFRYFFDRPNRQQAPSQSSGSGVIINAAGYIVTNNHVVEGADMVEVTLWDNRELEAEVVGTDPDTDLAVIKIQEEDLPYLSFVDSDQSRVGEWVLAVGNPFNLNSTVTAGIISAKGRNINIINRGGGTNTAIESFIQTDAAINPGNSGGALVNLDGGLIGINTAIASPTGSYSGYGFAVPANLVSKVVEDLITFGVVQRGWLGVQIVSVTSELAREYDLQVSEGAYVSEFPEKSAAKLAGVEKGDVVIGIDDRIIKTNTDLIGYIGQRRPGDKVKVKVDRDGEELIFTVTLKNKDGDVAEVLAEKEDALASLGIGFEDVDDQILRRMRLEGGVRVSEIKKGKIQSYTDMREGFIVTHIDSKRVNSADEAMDLLEKKKSGEQVIFAGQYENFSREYLFALRM